MNIYLQRNIYGSIAADYIISYAGLVTWQLILLICSQYKGVGMGTKYHFIDIKLCYEENILVFYSNAMIVDDDRRNSQCRFVQSQ